MKTPRFLSLVFCMLLMIGCLPLTHAQTSAMIEGFVRDSTGVPVPLATVTVVGTDKGISTDEYGFFRLGVPANATVSLRFGHNIYQAQEKSYSLKPGETRRIDIYLREKVTYLRDVEVAVAVGEKGREEAGTVALNPRSLKEIPTPFLDFNQALASGGALGIMSNNELSGSYSVRGGSFDENLVYVDNIQVYRPFLARSGEQEGLSFINPELVRSVEFSSGGWQPQYGDKLSSVLNVAYKQPQRSAGSLTLGLLGGAAHWEDASKNGRFRFVAGVRHKASRYLLNTLETDGQYLPRFTDFQAFLTYDLSGKNRPKNTTTLSWLIAYARNRYDFEPQSRVTRFGTFFRQFRLEVLFLGDESMYYDTQQSGLKLTHRFGDRLTSHLIVSGMNTREREYINVEGGYFLCDINTNAGGADANECVFVRGTGSQFRYARNSLEARIWTAEWRNTWRLGSKTWVDFGARADRERIDDVLYEYSFLDSADFVQFESLTEGLNSTNSTRLSGYAQITQYIGESHTLTFGARANYWSLNGQGLVSPRLQYAFRPRGSADIVFRLAAGLYAQPPFYRELRDFAGTLNRNLQAQESVHLIGGLDWSFRQWGRPFKLVAEAYYKRLWNVVPYDVDNVRLRYYATNSATATVQGVDVRVSGEFIPGTESWFNLSVLSAQEEVENDERGRIRRPFDQRVTMSFFFQDHLPNDPSIRVYLRLLYGTGVPYGPPNFPQFRQALSSGTDYLRSDIGFSKILTFKPKGDKRRLESVWIGLEILNLFGRDNNISFNWVPDLFGNQYAVPNSLSQRFFNLRTVIRY